MATAAFSPAGALPDPRRDPRDFLRALFATAVRSALPLQAMAAHLPPPPRGRTVVVGAGKAGASMAQAVEALWPGATQCVCVISFGGMEDTNRFQRVCGFHL